MLPKEAIGLQTTDRNDLILEGMWAIRNYSVPDLLFILAENYGTGELGLTPAQMQEIRGCEVISYANDSTPYRFEKQMSDRYAYMSKIWWGSRDVQREQLETMRKVYGMSTVRTMIERTGQALENFGYRGYLSFDQDQPYHTHLLTHTQSASLYIFQVPNEGIVRVAALSPKGAIKLAKDIVSWYPHGVIGALKPLL